MYLKKICDNLNKIETTKNFYFTKNKIICDNNSIYIEIKFYDKKFVCALNFKNKKERFVLKYNEDHTFTDFDLFLDALVIKHNISYYIKKIKQE